MDVRKAQKKDISRLLDLWEERQVLLQQADRRFADQVIDRKGLEASLLYFMDRDTDSVLVAVQDDQQVGFIVGEITATGIGKISVMALDAHKYYAGVGRQLYYALKANFEEASVTRVVAIVPRFHAVEQAFWRSLGGEEFIVTKDMDEEQWEIPRVFMWMTL
ncbi:MAG: hypothetical protein RLP44_13705 [Aggregatilineales bacterium]